MKKRLVLIFIFMLCFVFTASAEDKDLYKEQFNASGIEEIGDEIPYTAKEFLSDFSIDISDSEWVNSLSGENAIKHIISFVKNGAAPILKTLGIILSLVILSSIITTSVKENMSDTVTFTTVLAIATVLLNPIYTLLTATVDAIYGCAAFITAFIPIFAGIIAASGKPLTSASMSSILLLAASFVSFVANSVVIPLMGGHLSLSVAASVSPLLQNANLAGAVKKLSLWIMGFVSTIFLGILSIQTAVNSSADSLSLRTAKFIVGSTIPVAGGVLSEALSTVTASLSLLKSSVGIWGVLICAATLLPLLCELLIWRFGLWALSFLSDTLSVPKVSALLKSLDSVLSVLVGIVLLTAALFIISLSVVIIGGKGV